MNPLGIFEIAKELNISSNRLIRACKDLGIEIRDQDLSIDKAQKDRLVAAFKKTGAESSAGPVTGTEPQAGKARTLKKTAAKKKAKSTISKIKWIKVDGTASDDREEAEEEPGEELEEEITEEITEIKPVKVKAVRRPVSGGRSEKNIKDKETSGKKKTPAVLVRKDKTKKPVKIKEKLTEAKKPARVLQEEKVIKDKLPGADKIKEKAEDKVESSVLLKAGQLSGEEVKKEAVKEEAAGFIKVNIKEKEIAGTIPEKDKLQEQLQEEKPEEEDSFVEIEEEKFIKKSLVKDKNSEALKPRQSWSVEKKLNIRKVLDKELDKEEREGRLRSRIRPGSAKRTAPDEKTLEIIPGKSAGKKKSGQKEKIIKRPEIKKIIEIPEGITVKQLSEKIGISSEEIIQVLFNMGEAFSINQLIDKDIVEILSNELSFKYSIIDFDDKIDEISQDSSEDLVPRPPIVTVMGHVDHGKTTLLDAIRKSDVVSGEAGGITQRIGAYQTEYKGRKITFIDTPGHEAFTSMRARGARVTDIAVIVVAADDGIMPQTIEAINHAKDAQVTIIVAVNKIDLPDANPEKVKQGMTEYELVPEEWGGDTIFVNISAKGRQNIDELLEMILLVADMNNIRGNPSVDGSGIIIESRLDKNFGAVGTVLVRRGKIKTGDCFVTGNSFGRIRTIRNDRGEIINDAGLSQPVEISGFGIVPQAGDKFFVVKSEKMAKEIISRREYQKQALRAIETKRHITLEDLSGLSKENELKKLKIVLKAESYGSLDAVEKALKDAEENNIKIEIIHKAVGAISDTDILLASASDTIVIGFGVVATSKAKLLAKEENVEVRTYKIIYKLIDDIKLASKGLLEPEFEEKIKGNAEVREVFKITKVGIVAGSYILDGEIERGNSARLVRDGKIVFDGKIESLHRFKEDVKKVSAGYECGIKIENFQDIDKGDLLEVYELVEVTR